MDDLQDKIMQMIIEITGDESILENRQIDLFDEEILDSLAFIQLVEALEDEFNIEIQPTQISPDVWRSVEKITNTVRKLQ